MGIPQLVGDGASLSCGCTGKAQRGLEENRLADLGIASEQFTVRPQYKMLVGLPLEGGVVGTGVPVVTPNRLHAGLSQVRGKSLEGSARLLEGLHPRLGPGNNPLRAPDDVGDHGHEQGQHRNGDQQLNQREGARQTPAAMERRNHDYGADARGLRVPVCSKFAIIRDRSQAEAEFSSKAVAWVRSAVMRMVSCRR